MYARNLDELTQASRFVFGRRFEPSAASAFFIDVFNSPEFRQHFAPVSRSKAAAPLAGKVESVDYERLRTAVLSLDFFDRFQSEGAYG